MTHLIFKNKRLVCIVLLLPILVSAESVFVIDQIKIGIHEQSDLDSPILKLVGTGTELEIKQRGVDMSQIVDPDGITGWVNTAYLIDNEPGIATADGNAEVVSLRTELGTARSEIKQLKTDLAKAADIEGSEQVKALRIQIGELEAKLTEQRKLSSQLVIPGEGSNPDTELSSKNAELQQTVDDLKSQLTLSESVNTEPRSSLFNLKRQHLLLYLLLPLVIGMGLGIFFYDLYKRHQHGGFRV